MINLGLRAHDFLINDDIEKLAENIEKTGIHYIQFANNISLSGITDQGKKVNSGLGLQVKNILKKHQIEIGVLSCYYNVIHPNLEKQIEGINQFKHFLTVASSYGANLVATEPGSLDPDFNPTPLNYENKIVKRTLNRIGEMTDYAEKLGIFVGIEAGINHPIHSLKTIQQMFDTVQSPALKLIFDPVNLLDHENKEQVYDIVEEGLQRFLDQIYAIHIKDYIFEDQKEIVRPGTGIMDFKRLFKIINQYQPGALVILDEAPREGLEASIAKLQNLAK